MGYLKIYLFHLIRCLIEFVIKIACYELFLSILNSDFTIKVIYNGYLMITIIL